MNISGVPETIKRDQLITLIEELGLNCRDLVWMSILPHAVEAEVFATDENGDRFRAKDDTVAKHMICIKVVD